MQIYFQEYTQWLITTPTIPSISQTDTCAQKTKGKEHIFIQKEKFKSDNPRKFKHSGPGGEGIKVIDNENRGSDFYETKAVTNHCFYGFSFGQKSYRNFQE